MDEKKSIPIPREQSYLFSSDPANGAINVTQNGSRFTVQLDSPIVLPQNARAATIEVSQSSIWYVSPNISSRLAVPNNQFHVIISATPYSFVIPDGLYSVSALNQTISREMVALGFNADQIILTADNATQKTVLTFNYVNTQVDFTQPNTCRTILGFDSRLSPLAPSTAGQSDIGDNVAEFNSLSAYLIHTNLTSRGIPVNNLGANVIARVPIDAQPGRQINFSPFQPTKSDARELVGKSVNQLDVYLTDQNNVPIDTFDEVFDVLVVIRYYA